MFHIYCTLLQIISCFVLSHIYTGERGDDNTARHYDLSQNSFNYQLHLNDRISPVQVSKNSGSVTGGTDLPSLSLLRGVSIRFQLKRGIAGFSFQKAWCALRIHYGVKHILLKVYKLDYTSVKEKLYKRSVCKLIKLVLSFFFF